MPYYPIKIVIGTLLISATLATDSACLLSSNAWRDVWSKYSLNLTINASLSVAADETKLSPFNVTSDPGIGIVEYLFLTNPKASLALAKVYSKIQLLPIELILVYVGFTYGTFDVLEILLVPSSNAESSLSCILIKSNTK